MDHRLLLVLVIESGRSEDPVRETRVEKRLYSTRLRPLSLNHDYVLRMTAINCTHPAGVSLVVTLCLLPDSIVIRVLAPSRSVLISMKAFSPGALSVEVEQLTSAVGCHLEDAGTGPVQNGGQEPAELVLDRCELAYQRRTV